MENYTTIPEILREQLLGLFAILPVLLKTIIILVVGVIIARVLRRFVKKLAKMIKLDSLADKMNEVDMIKRSGREIKISSILSSIVYYFVILVFAMTAIEALGMKMVSELLVDFINYIPKALTAFVILLFGIFVADFLKKIVDATCQSLGIKAGTLIANVIFYFIFLNVVLIALRQAEMQTEFMENNITVVLAGAAGAFAIGYGLASREIMANMLSSFYNRGRLSVGDEITINNQRGEVIQLSTSSITLRSNENESEIIIPFQELSKSGVEIHSRRGADSALPPHTGM